MLLRFWYYITGRTGSKLISEALGGIEAVVRKLDAGLAACEKEKEKNNKEIYDLEDKIQEHNDKNRSIDTQTERANRVIKNLTELIK